MLFLHPNYPFSYCLDTYVVRDPGCIGYCCNSANLLDKIGYAYAAGYSGVELWHPDLEKFVAHGGTLEQVRRYLLDHNLTVPSYKVIEGVLEGKQEDRWKRVLEFASAIGAESVVVKMIKDNHSGPVPGPQQACDRYHALLMRAELLNVKPSLEFMSCAPAYNNILAACEIVKRVRHPNARLVLDTFHLWRKGDKDFYGFEQAIEECGLTGDMVSVVHFTDASATVPRDQQNDGHRKLPGLGLLNLNRFVRLLGKIRYRGPLSLNTYDQSLWTRDPLEVATEGFYRMHRAVKGDEFESLRDGQKWRGRQEVRCDGLWTQDYLTHLDPRTVKTSRDRQLDELLGNKLRGKHVLDFKCGFAPLGEYVTVGFDAYEGCITYLKKQFPQARWYCMDDEKFADWFEDKIDVLLHLGLGDSDSEVNSCLKLRQRCKPELVVLECCANDDGTVNNAKPGATRRWERLKSGLVGESIVYKTNMPKRPTRLLFVGRPC